MKPTDTQMTVIDAVIDQLEFWKCNNILNSPTQPHDMSECIQVILKDTLSKGEIEELKSYLCNLFHFIKYLAA